MSRSLFLAGRLGLNAAGGERFAEQELDLRIHTAQVRCREAFELGPQLWVDA